MRSTTYIPIYPFFTFFFLHVQTFSKDSLLLFLSEYFLSSSFFFQTTFYHVALYIYIYVVNVVKNKPFVTYQLNRHFLVNKLHETFNNIFANRSVPKRQKLGGGLNYIFEIFINYRTFSKKSSKKRQNFQNFGELPPPLETLLSMKYSINCMINFAH
jgi:hypothetical protein